MRVFVTGVGRCASVTFSKVCQQHITNYGCGHETPNLTMEYPDNWIEVSPHIRRDVSLLASRYPEACWVHLRRAQEPSVRSLAALDGGAIMQAYRLLYPTRLPVGDLAAAAAHYWVTENEALALRLARYVPVAQQCYVFVDQPGVPVGWQFFWTLIGAIGDFAKSRDAWIPRYNTTAEREAKQRELTNGTVRAE